MASTITAGNATNGLALSCDNTGILELKTGTGAGTTAMTIDASQVTSFAGATTSFSGNVGIGQTPTAYGATVRTVEAYIAGAAGYTLVSAATASVKTEISAGEANLLGQVGTRTNHPLAIKTNDTERARIDTSGNLLVGTTSVYDNSRFTLETSSAQPNGIAVKTFGNNNALAFWRNSTTYAGAITLSGSGTAYTSASDYRLKENVQPMTGALAKVAALKPCTYTWKVDGADGQGFIAHELAEVVPEAVSGEKDAVNEDGSIKPQGIDTSFLVATLTAAIQELKAELDATKAEVAALKGA